MTNKLNILFLPCLQSNGFWIGDPCYVLSDDEWKEFCDSYINRERITGGQNQITEYNFADKKIWVWDIPFGDSSYPLYINNSFIRFLPCDSGIFSIIPIDIVRKSVKVNKRNWGYEITTDQIFFAGFKKPGEINLRYDNNNLLIKESVNE